MVTPISGSSSSSATSSAQDQMQKVKEDVLAAVAKELGESESDLQKAMGSGQSLEQLAAAKGISSDDLKSTVEAVVKKDMPNASDTQVANIANRMVHGAHGHHHHAAAAPAPDPDGDGDTDASSASSSSTSVHVVA